ncbi:unnamed protein product [Owenia fusiformis]|uniref:Uncharacterized protein n=1 Tax=Owenia fusiformis TaxID=6347 RepID=A0A8J1UUC4_OWEFU|nr:unnamed protein product [Owenia fusiformis]
MAGFKDKTKKREYGEGKKPGIDLVFKGINYDIGERSILKDVSGIAKQGDMLAVMGPSGSGKTTLLNVVAGRIVADSGEISLSGQPISKRMRKKMCYVLQQDIFYSNLTLRQTLTYTALLRLPEKMPKKEKIRRVEEIVDALDLRKCLDTIIGDVFQRGLSGGEQKRANIANEILTDPMLMLLDEPTSGLDSNTACNLMKIMKSYTQVNNKTVMTTIHQPSSQIYHLFDRVLLMTEGQVAYFGEGSKILSFFSSVGLECSMNYNPADFILEKVNEEKDVQDAILEAANKLRDSEDWPVELHHDYKTKQLAICDKMTSGKINEAYNIDEVKLTMEATTEKDTIKDSTSGKALAVPVTEFDDKTQEQYDDANSMLNDNEKWVTSWWTQYSVLTRRNLFQAKDRILSKFNIIQTMFLALLTSLFWFQMPRTEATLKDRIGLIFFTSIYFGFFSIIDAITAFPEDRAVVNKERSSGAYRLSAYFFAKMSSEIPLIIAQPLVFVSIVFWVAGLNGVTAYFGDLAVIILGAITAQGFGLIFGASFKIFKMSFVAGTMFMLFNVLAGGFYTVNLPYWIGWIKYLSVVLYVYNIQITYEFTNAPPVLCVGGNLTSFPECLNPNVTSIDQSEYLQSISIGWPLWAMHLALFVFLLVSRTTAYLILRFKSTRIG